MFVWTSVAADAGGAVMRLRDLDAHFIDDAHAGGSHLMESDSVEGAQGVMFQCPKCGEGREVVVDQERTTGSQVRRYVVGAHYIRVFFANPRSASIAPPDADLGNNGKPNPRWQLVSGTSLDDLTLAPSINCDIPNEETGEPSSCKFHGHVTNGDAA